MVVVRLCKVALVASIAFFFTLVTFGNITEYDSNWQFVVHTLSMDTTFANSSLHWRAITNPNLQKIAYWLIIAIELATTVILWIGVARLLKNIRSPDFAPAKSLAVAGLTLGLLLYVVGFIVVGAEWFVMWQSPAWNGQTKAFGFIMMISVVLIFLHLPDGEHPAS